MGRGTREIKQHIETDHGLLQFEDSGRSANGTGDLDRAAGRTRAVVAEGELRQRQRKDLSWRDW